MIKKISNGFSKRGMALLLAVCMVFTMSPPITAAEASTKDSGETILLSGFKALADEVREQSVPLGTSSVELNLPDTLEATVYSVSEDIEPVLPAKPTEPELTEPEEPAPPTVDESESTPAPSQPQDSGVVEKPAGETDEPVEETTKPTEETSMPTEEPIKPAEESDEAVEETSAPKTEIIKVSMIPLSASPSDAENNEPEPTLPSNDVTTPTAITIEGITWESNPIYDSETAGTYTFTAVLPEGYTVEDGVALPTITVTVGQQVMARALDAAVVLDENNTDPTNGLIYQVHMYMGNSDIGTAEIKGYTAGTTTGDLVIPESVQLNGENAPRSVRNVGSYAFKDCTGITSVTFPKSLSITDSAFSFAFVGCSSLTEFRVAEGHTSLSVKDGVLFSLDGTRLYAYPTGIAGPYTIPEGTTSVYWNAFVSRNSLTDITFPSNAIDLGSSAFMSCTGLTEVTIPARVSMSSGVFSRCTSLKTVIVEEPRTEIPTTTFEQCTAVESYSLPLDSLVKLGTYSFSGYSLTQFDFTKITDIGTAAFSSGKLVGDVVLPEVTSMEKSAFSSCVDLKSVSVPKLTKLNMATFADCSKLERVYLPEVTKIIEANFSGIFSGCSSLKTVSFPKLTGIAANSFSSATGLTTASFPSLTAIGKEAFGKGSQTVPLATLALPAAPPTVDNTGEGAFTKCTAAGRTLLFVNADGTPLTNITAAHDAYKAEDDGNTGDELWYGWKIPAAPTTSVTVTYDANSPTSGTVPNATTVNGSVNLAANSGSLARTGYTFTGWNTLASGAGTHYDVSEGVTLAGFLTDTTLYAEWTLTAPTAVTITGNTGTPSGGRVTLTANATHMLTSGITYTYKWYKGDSPSIAPGTATVGTGKAYTTPALTADASYFCVVTATGTGGKPSAPTASAAHTITVSVAPEAPPAVTIDYTNEKLTGFVSGGSYTVDGSAVILTGTTLALEPGWFGTTLSIVKKGATVAQDSPAQSLAIPARPATPAAHTITTGTTTLTVSAVTGVEYSIDNWATKNTTGTFAGLTPGTEYTVKSRIPATVSAFASAERSETATTKVSIAAPTGGGANGTVTANKTVAALGDTVTYTVTFADGYTPTLTLSGNSGSLAAPTKSTTENKWTYTYTVTSGDKTVGAAASFAARTVASIAVPSATVTLFADDANNVTAAALKAYLGSNVKVTATYDNGTTAEVSATYALKTGTWAAQGGGYTYTATASGKTCDVTVTVKAVTAAITAIPAISKPVNASGYTTHAALGLPTTATITYTGDGYTQKTVNLAVLWSAIPANFGESATTGEIFTGTVTLPAWASGSSTTTVNISITNKTDISNKLSVVLDGWAYGDMAKTPMTNATGGITIDQSKLTYLYTGSNNATPPTGAGSYSVTVSYSDATQTGSAMASFAIERAALTITGGTVTPKAYDGTAAAAVTFVTFDGLQNSETLSLTTDYAVSSAAFDNANVGTNKPVTATVTLVGTGKAANYTLTNGALSTTGTINQEADGTKNLDYAAALAELNKVHIITNVTPTLGDVTLPANWSFTSDKTAKLVASNDNSGKQNFAVKYTSQNPNYADVTIASQAFPVSMVAVTMSKLKVVTIPAIGNKESLSATVTVTGAALTGDLTVSGMEWRSSCPEIVSLSNASMGGTATVTAKGDAKGVSMVGVTYKNGGMLGYVLVKVIDNSDDSANTISQIKDITDTIDKLVNKDNPTEGDKGAVNAVADEVTKLPEDTKKNLSETDVKSLDELKQSVNQGALTITIDETPEGTAPPAPTGVTAVGTAIACGVDTGAVTYYVTPVAPTATDVKMELKLDMAVDSAKGKQIQAPLFFTMTLPSSVDVSKLTIKHIKDGGTTETVSFTHSGQTVSFKLDSFSGLQFVVTSGVIPTPPPSGGDNDNGGGGGGSSYDAYTITATAHEGGEISPSGRVKVAKYSDKTFTITPDKGWQLEKVLIDGKREVTLTNDKYTFKNVTEPYTIDAYFVKSDVPVIPDAGDKTIPETGGTDGATPGKTTELSGNDTGGGTAFDTETGSGLETGGTTASGEGTGKDTPAVTQPEDTEQTNPADSTDTDNRPFVALSAMFVLAGLAFASITTVKKKSRKRKIISIVASVGAVAVFLLTTGWSGVALANWWSIPVGILAVVAGFAMLAKDKAEEQESMTE